MARIDHLRNCLLCHPAAPTSPEATDVPGAVQFPGYALAREGGPGPQAIGHIVFLRQDVSATYDRDPPGGDWPRLRRFDFVAYARPLSDDERREHLVRRADAPPVMYPQREAVRWAIRELSR